MKLPNKKNIRLSTGLLSLAIAQSLAFAADPGPIPGTEADNQSSSSTDSGGGGSGINTQISGFIRSDTAVNTTGQTDPFNQNGNKFNGVPIERPIIQIPGVGIVPGDVATRTGQQDGQNLNLQLFRAEVNLKTNLTDSLTFQLHARVVGDPGFYNEYDPAKTGTNVSYYNYGQPNYFKYYVPGVARPNPLEWTGRNYMIDLPAAFLEFNQGPLDIRIGNQQIAWGQALFFRVLDVPDGLDYRRHSILDYAPEEFSDKRVPALGLRVSFQMTDAWLLDSYVQKFQPTIYGNANTPYQIIPSQFTVRDGYEADAQKIDEGIRLKGSVGDFGVQFMFSHRHNPDGVFAWTKSNINRPIPGADPASGFALSQTPFEIDPTGVWSANEWFYYAAQARLSGIGGLNAAINDFQPFTGGLGAVPVPNKFYADATLNSFFALAGGYAVGQHAGGLRGWLSRQYKEENVIGTGLSYTTSGPPGSLLDQMIINWETTYTPNRTFTAPDLNVDHLTAKEWTSAVSLEKYQSIFPGLPATYLVGEFEYKSKSDLFGRYLGGMGGTEFLDAPGTSGGFKAAVIAIQQPFANLVWRFDMSVLYDLQGGVLIQPALRWKPDNKWTVEAFYNYINSHLGGNPNRNIFGGLDYAKELTLRVGYQF